MSNDDAAKHKSENWIIRLVRRATTPVSFLIGGLGLYLTIHEKKPELTYDVVSESNILDIHTRRPDITILFQNEDIQNKNLNLRLMRILVINTGEASIVSNSYDATDTLGLRVIGGRPLEARLINASSTYLKGKVKPQLLPPDIVGLPKVILDKGEHFLIELLILHDKASPLNIIPLGKIANMERIAIRRSFSEKKDQSFYRDILEASFPVHAFRLLVYFIGGITVIMALIIIGATLSKIKEDTDEKRRHKQITAVLKSELPKEDPIYQLLQQSYVRLGNYGLVVIRDILEYAVKYPELVRRKALNLSVISFPDDEHADTSTMFLPGPRFIWYDIIQSGLVSIQESGEVIVDPRLQPLLDLVAKKLGINSLEDIHAPTLTDDFDLLG